MLADPVPNGAVGQPSVGLLQAGAEVGDLGAVNDPFRHAVAWQWALSPTSMAVAPSTGLHLLSSAHLGVVLVHLLRHVGHGGVGDLHSAPIDDPPQLMVRREAGVNEL